MVWLAKLASVIVWLPQQLLYLLKLIATSVDVEHMLFSFPSDAA